MKFYFILSINDSSIELKLIDKDSKWTDAEIIYAGFRTSYETELIKNVLQRRV
jgi:hypothetical protein